MGSVRGSLLSLALNHIVCACVGYGNAEIIKKGATSFKQKQVLADLEAAKGRAAYYDKAVAEAAANPGVRKIFRLVVPVQDVSPNEVVNVAEVSNRPTPVR